MGGAGGSRLLVGAFDNSSICSALLQIKRQIGLISDRHPLARRVRVPRAASSIISAGSLPTTLRFNILDTLDLQDAVHAFEKLVLLEMTRLYQRMQQKIR